MTNKFELSKKIQFVLDKRNINNIPCEVKFAVDVSGSIRSLYTNGVIQEVVEKIFAIAFSVDIDKKLDIVAFDDTLHTLPIVTEDNLAGYIDKHITRSLNCWGGTNYSPSIEFFSQELLDAINVDKKKQGLFSRLFSKQQSTSPIILPSPSLCIMITDGECFDERETEQALIDTQQLNMYWQLIGVGRSSSTQFTFLKYLADTYPNVGYTPITDLKTIPDDDLYDSILNDEFAEWVLQDWSKLTKNK